MSDFISTHIYIYVLYVCYTIEIDSTGHPIPKAEKTGMYVCMYGCIYYYYMYMYICIHICIYLCIYIYLLSIYIYINIYTAENV
jgi:hypothetical protein